MKKILVWITVLLVGAGGYFFGFNKGIKFEEYEFLRVVDGDTVMVKDVRNITEKRVRVLGIDAPELTLCAGEEAKKYLNGLFVNKSLKLEKVGEDSFGRIVAKVYAAKNDVALEVLQVGYAQVDDASKDHIRAAIKPSDEYLIVLRSAEGLAKKNNLGVWSKECLAKEPINDSKCLIKGNYRDGKKAYYPPDCSQYKTVVVEEQAGDEWLCSEEQAKALGFSLAESCKL